MNNRIAPQDVRKAYKRTGLKPKRGRWLDKRNNCACALGAMIADKKVEIQETQHPYNGKTVRWTDTVRRGFGLSWSYINYFWRGFDGWGKESWPIANHSAYQDGKAAWEAVKDLA